MVRKSKLQITKMRKYIDNKLHIFQYNDQKNWYARFYAQGKYKVRSLKETKFEVAKEIAHEWYFELKGKQKSGIPIHGVKFKDLLIQFLEYQQSRVNSGALTKRQHEQYEILLKGPLKYFNDFYVSDITTNEIDLYRQHRIHNDKVKQITIEHDYVPLQQFLKFCKLRELIKIVPDNPPRTKAREVNPRPYFDKTEWKHLQKVSNERIKTSRGTRIRNDRQQIHDFMLFMVHCGTRVEETLRIKFRDCKIHKKKNPTNKSDDRELRFTIQGKTGVRPVRGMIGAVSAFERLKVRHTPKGEKQPNPDDFLFPKNHYSGIDTLMKEAGLKHDKFGRKRNARSFRSTYIMYRLIDNIPIKSIAINCGTSSDVIDNFYARFLDSDLLGDSFTDLPKKK
jgi:integrase